MLRNIKPCPKCKTGRLEKQRYDRPCRSCRKTGAATCRNDIVEIEWSCVNCGFVINEPLQYRWQLEPKPERKPVEDKPDRLAGATRVIADPDGKLHAQFG